MCGRYAVAATVEQIVARFNANPAPEGQEWTPRYNLAPSQANPVVVRDDEPVGERIPEDLPGVGARVAAHDRAAREPLGRRELLWPILGASGVSLVAGVLMLWLW